MHASKGHSIYHNLIINVSKQRVFSAISEPEHLINWWPLKCQGTPLEGEEYRFFFGPEYDWRGEVIKSTPDVSFHIKMTQSDSDWNPTSFGFDLEEKNGKTLLQFWHKNWPEQNHHFKYSSFCWAMLLNGLKNYLEHTIVIPFEERE